MAFPSSYPLNQTQDSVLETAINGFYWYDGPYNQGSVHINWSISNGFYDEYWLAPASLVNALNSMVQSISSYTNLQFEYRGYFDNPSVAYQNGSDINFGLDGSDLVTTDDAIWAIGHFPTTQMDTLYNGQSGDVFLNINSEANNLSYQPASAGWALMLHELGHTLGLKHPHDSGGTARPTLSDLGLNDLDIDWFSVMSYEDDNSINRLEWDPITLMPLDIIGLQYLYGKNMQHHAGDTVYSPTDDILGYGAVWDAGGTDTIDYAQANQGYEIVLPSVLLSPTVGTYTGSATPMSEVTAYEQGDKSGIKTLVWYLGNIEKAIGTDFDDRILGNHLDNTITAGKGDDFIHPGGGNNLIDGGPGEDTIRFNGELSEYGIDYYHYDEAFHVLDQSSGRDEISELSDIENLFFAETQYDSTALIETFGRYSKVNVSDFFSSYQIELSEAQDFVLDHLNQPEYLYGVVKDSSVTNEMLADMFDVTAPFVENFWASYQLDPTLLSELG